MDVASRWKTQWAAVQRPVVVHYALYVRALDKQETIR